MRRTLGIIPYCKIAVIISTLFLCFQTSSYAADITLQWDANTEPDLDHYVIYWDTSFDPPYANNSGNIDKSQTTYTVTGLSNDTMYYFAAKAFDTEGLKSYYSNVVGTDETDETHEVATPMDSGGGGGGCFIATAAYGSNMDRHVQILSEFRDRRLLTNPIGRSIVEGYYKFSPPVADYLRNHPFARAIVRYALIPITGIAYISLYIHPLALLLAFILLLLAVVYCVRRLSRLRINISQ